MVSLILPIPILATELCYSLPPQVSLVARLGPQAANTVNPLPIFQLSSLACVV